MLRLLPLLMVGCLLLLQSLQPTAAVSAETKKKADDRLAKDFQVCPMPYQEIHLPFKYDDSQTKDAKYLKILCQDGYIIRYSTRRKTPLFTAERLDGSVLKAKREANSLPKRNKYFRADPRLNLNERSSDDEYKNQKTYTRGHLAAAEDMTGNIAKINTFVLSNIAPQYPTHNSKAWANWEDYTHEKAEKHGVVFVITGVTGGTGKMSNNVIIPMHWYKLLVWCKERELQAEYIFAEHKNEKFPSTQRGSSETPLPKEINRLKAVLKTVKEVENFIRQETNIQFQISTSGLCEGGGPIPRQLALLTFNQKYKASQQNFRQNLCKKINNKLQKLAIMGKLSLSHSSRRGNDVLNIGNGYFSAGCRKASDLQVLQEYYDGHLVITTDHQNSTKTLSALEKTTAQAATKALTGYVKRGQTLRLLDFLAIRHRKVLSPINIKLQKIVSDCKAKDLDIYTAPSRKFTFVPGVLSVRNAVLSIRISYGKENKNVIAGITGQWAIGNIVVHVLARYDTNSMKLLLRGAPKNKLTIDLKNELDSLTGTYVPIPLPSVSLTNIAVTGLFDLMKGGLATIVVSGSIGKNRVHAVFQKPLKAGKFSGAFAADFGPIRLSNIIRKTTQVDISRVPFFGSLTIPRLGVTVSSDYITSSLLPNVFCKEGLLQNTAVTIPKGLQAFTILSLRGTKVPLKMYYYKSSLSFEVIRNGRFPIGTLISTIPGINIRSLPLPPGVKDILQFQIDYFSFDTSSKKLLVSTQYPGTLRFFNGYLTITKPSLTVNAVLKHPRKVYFEVDGAIKIGKGDYVITISRDPSTNKYILKASFKKIPFSDFIHKFSATVLPRAFQNRLKKFIQFSIHNVKLALPLGTRNLQLHLSGTPVIGGYKTVHLSAIIIRQGGKTKLVAGFQLGKTSLANLMYKITGKNIRGIAILNQELDTSILISPVSLPGVRLYGSKLKNINIVKGVYIHAALKWPQNCARDKFCAVAQRVLGRNAQFSLQATIASANSFTLSAGVSDVRLGSGVVLQRAALQVMVGRETSVGIEGAIHLNKIGITLSAGLRTGSRGVVLQGNMQGCWKKAFGLKWLSICNLHLLIAIQPTVTLVGALEIGGQIRLGNPSCLRHPIIASGYMGVDQLSPKNNFYYAKMNRLTMGTLLRAFCIRFRLPRPLAESGFPRGFLSSFSPIGKELPKVGISIPAGFRLKGTINILGLEAHADMIINLPKGVKMSVALSPLRIAGGLLQMYASSRDRSRGPFLKVFITAHPRPKVDIRASGFVSVLGIQQEAMLRITNTQYEYRIAGKFLHLFQASLHITAKYGNIKRAEYRVRGHLRNDFFAIIRRKIQRGLQSSSRAATKAIDNAKRKVNSKKVVFDRAIGKLRSAQHRVNRVKGAFTRAMNKLRRWEGKVRRLCRIKRCGSVCIGCPGLRCWKRIKIWGRRRCVMVKPYWRRCCKRIRNPVCITKNVLCKGLRIAAIAGLRAARFLVGKSRHIFDAANVVLKGVEHVVRISKRSLDIVNALLEGVKILYQAGTKALSAIISFGLGGVFDIREFTFDVALSTAATGHFRASIVVSIFRKLKRFSLNINLKNILSFVKAIGERIIRGLKKFF